MTNYPSINGTLKSNGPVTNVNIRIRISNFMLVFMAVWCGFIGHSLFIEIFGTPKKQYSWITSLGMLLLMYIALMSSFRNELKKTKKEMADLFEVTAIPK